MSFGVYVFLNKVPSAASWTAAIRRVGFDIELDSSFDPLTHDGFVPCKFGTCIRGLEYSLFARDDVASIYPKLAAFVIRYESVASFTWKGDFIECAIGIVAASVLTGMSAGLMYEPQDAVRFTGLQAVEYARRTLAEISKLI